MVMPLNTRVSKTCIVLVILGLADLVSTVVLVETGMAEEANPLMRAVLAHGWLPFCVVKCATLAAFVWTLTWYRQRRPRLASVVEVATTAGYAVIYTSLFSALNL